MLFRQTACTRATRVSLHSHDVSGEAERGLLAERIRKATAESTVGPKLYSKRYDHYISKRLPV